MGLARLQPMLGKVFLHLEQRLRESKGQNKTLRLDHVYAAFTADVIGRICLGSAQSSVSTFLDHPDFSPEWY